MIQQLQQSIQNLLKIMNYNLQTNFQKAFWAKGLMDV